MAKRMTWYFVAEYKSLSHPEKQYVVKRDEHGNLGCSCPCYVFNIRHNRTCRHTDDAMERFGGTSVAILGEESNLPVEILKGRRIIMDDNVCKIAVAKPPERRLILQ